MLEFFETSTAQPARRRGGGRRRAPRRALGRRHRAAAATAATSARSVAQEQLIEDGLDPVLDRARDAVLRVRRRASPTRPPTATPSACRRCSSSRWPPTTSPRAVGEVAVGAPLNGMVEVAGPEQFRLDELVRRGLRGRRRSAHGGRRPAGALLRRRAATSARSSPAPARASARSASRTGWPRRRSRRAVRDVASFS